MNRRSITLDLPVLSNSRPQWTSLGDDGVVSIGIGVVGTGMMGRTYVRALRHMVPNADVVALHGGSRAADLAAEFDLPVAPSLDALLARRDVDAVLLASPTQLHRDQTVAAAAARKHVFTEKPIAATLPEIDEMIAACRSARVRLAVNAVTRYRTGFRMAKRMIDEGQIGEIRMVRHTYGHTGWDFEAGHWINRPEAGSPFLDQGSHCNDAIRWAVGDDVESVYAVYRDYGQETQKDLSAMVVLSFRHGVMCSIWASYEFPRPGLDPRKWTGDYLFVGSDGMLDVQYRGTTRLGKGDRWETVYEHPAVDGSGAVFDPNFVYAYADQVTDFAAAIDEDREPLVTGDEARKGIEIGLAADRSARTGQAVTLPLEA
jgi:predicted dehydrogenase